MHQITWMPGRPAAAIDSSAKGPRRWLSLTLLAVGGRLIRWAWHLASATPARDAPAAQTLEFCREAGALEGAVYVDGQLLGSLPGVGRL